MIEKLYYTSILGKTYFVHEHIPKNVKGYPYIFLNPIFDEKKRSQQFYARTAREFCKKGIAVVRFDYYGTGDSQGQLFETDFRNISNIVYKLKEDLFTRYKTQKINLFGLRAGADFAIRIAGENPDYVNDLILIEPIVIGNRYLTEQRSRRKIFYKINKITDISDEIMIDGKIYEDHQGYPISIENVQFLNEIESTTARLSQKNILLVKLKTISSRLHIARLKNKFEEENTVNYVNFPCDDFWANLEPVDSGKLSMEIVKKAKRLQSRRKPSK